MCRHGPAPPVTSQFGSSRSIFALDTKPSGHSTRHRIEGRHQKEPCSGPFGEESSAFTTTISTTDGRVTDTRRRGTCPNTSQDMDTPEEAVAEIQRGTLGILAAFQRGTTGILAPAAMGQYKRGWVRSTTEQRQNLLPPVWQDPCTKG